MPFSDLAADDRIELRSLRLLLLILRHETLSSAAASMNLSIAGASKLLSKARDVFDDKLFLRSCGRMIPTERMLDLEPRLARILDDLSELTTPAVPFEPATASGHVTIAATDNGAVVLLSPAIRIFAERAPGLSLSIVSLYGDTVEKMRSGEIDIALSGDDKLTLTSAFHSATLLQSKHVVLVRAGHPLCAKTTLTRDDFRPYRRILITMNKPSGGHYLPIYEWADDEESECAISTPYLMTAVDYLRGTDYFVSIPKEMADHLTADRPNEFAVLTDPVFNTLTWQPVIFWHDRTDRSPMHQWVRSVIIDALQPKP